MSRATFETATLADAIRKAARFAPSKGAELDRAGGIVIDLELPLDTPVATVRATNLNVFYRQTIFPLRLTVDRPHWRVSSVLLENVVSRLPMQLGSTVELWDVDGCLHLMAGKVQAKLNLFDIDASYPAWSAFDPYGMELVEGFSRRVAQARWATEAKAGNILSGVHIDGDALWATERTCAVKVALECPVDRPVTAPLGEVTELVRDHPEVYLRATTDALEILVDEDTQVRVILLAGEYPVLSGFLESPMTEVMTLDKTALLAAVDRLMVLDSGDRYPVMKMEFGESGLRLRREVPDIGWIDEQIELAEVPAPYEFWVNPLVLRNILGGTNKNEIEFAHGAEPLAPFRVADGDGYTATALPRRRT